MVARLHPNVATVYREKIARLREALNAEDTRTEAAETIRGLIEEVRLVPEEGRLRVELSGELAALISLANQHPRSSGTRVPVTLVAGARNHLNLLFNAPRLELPLWWRGLTATYGRTRHCVRRRQRGGSDQSGRRLFQQHERLRSDPQPARDLHAAPAAFHLLRRQRRGGCCLCVGGPSAHRPGAGNHRQSPCRRAVRDRRAQHDLQGAAPTFLSQLSLAACRRD